MTFLMLIGAPFMTAVLAFVVFATYFSVKFAYHKILISEMRKENING